MTGSRGVFRLLFIFSLGIAALPGKGSLARIHARTRVIRLTQSSTESIDTLSTKTNAVFGTRGFGLAPRLTGTISLRLKAASRISQQRRSFAM